MIESLFAFLALVAILVTLEMLISQGHKSLQTKSGSFYPSSKRGED